MKFKHRLKRLECQQQEKVRRRRALTDVPLEEWTDEELDEEIARLGGTLRTKDLRNLTDEELNRLLAESQAELARLGMAADRSAPKE